MGSVLIVDDNEDLRFSLSNVVRREGFSVECAPTGQAALEMINSTIIDLIFLDIGLPDTDGITLISEFRDQYPDVGIVMLTGINDAKTAVDSLKAGALDYIVKPFDIIEFRSVLNRHMQSRLMEKQAQLDGTFENQETLVGVCEPMNRVKKSVSTAADVHSPVLITGETGTGKEIVARTIHASQTRLSGIFVKVDCGTLSANLIESELFGYTQGAFTDARSDKKGLVEVASGGTLFLDEIGNLPTGLQPKLLRLIEEATFRKVGGIKDIKVHVRIIAATNANLKDEIGRGTFREDLFYRLNVIPIEVPALRDRGEDILLLADYFLHKLSAEMKKDLRGFTEPARAALAAYEWPGNIRELRNMLEHEVIFNTSGWASLAELRRRLKSGAAGGISPIMPLKQVELNHILKVLEITDNNKSRAARLLGITRTTLRNKLDRDTGDIG
jgi:DNA-binding NtrC family response regulator